MKSAKTAKNLFFFVAIMAMTVAFVTACGKPGFRSYTENGADIPKILAKPGSVQSTPDGAGLQEDKVLTDEELQKNVTVDTTSAVPKEFEQVIEPESEYVAPEIFKVVATTPATPTAPPLIIPPATPAVVVAPAPQAALPQPVAPPAAAKSAPAVTATPTKPALTTGKSLLSQISDFFKPAAPKKVTPSTTSPSKASAPAAAAGAPATKPPLVAVAKPAAQPAEPLVVLSPNEILPSGEVDEVAATPVPAPVKTAPAPVPTTVQGDWRDAKSPRNQAINLPSQGRLENATSLLERREKYGAEAPFEFSKRSIEQGRYYGTEDLVNFIDFIAQYFKSLGSGQKLLVSDLSVKAGGPVCCARASDGKILRNKKGQPVLSHQSHQNGTDADIAYVSSGPDRFFSLKREAPKSSVNLPLQFSLFKQGYKSNTVDFFIVHQSLKKELCILAYKEGAFKAGQEKSDTIETLKMLVPDAYGHADHFHVRVKCDPKMHKDCKPRSFSAKTHGCSFKAPSAAAAAD